MKNTTLSKIKLLSSMFIFGTIGIFVKYIPLPASIIAFFRGVTGALFLIAVMLISKRKISFAAIKNNLPKLLGSGALIGFNWIFLFESYRYTTVAVSTLCYYFAPAIVIMASPLILKEKITLKKWICVIFSMLGMVFVSGVLKSETPAFAELKGILFGLAAAALYASVILTNKNIKDISAYDKTIVQLLAAAVVVLPYCILTENLSALNAPPVAIILLAVVGIVHTGISYLLYFGSMDGLKSQTVAILSYTDPVVALILSALILHENMGAFEIAGALLIIGSAIVSELPEKLKIDKN